MRIVLLVALLALLPSHAMADPVSLVAIVALAAGGAAQVAFSSALVTFLVTTAISIAGALLQQALAPTAGTRGQNKSRGRDFDPHPPFRFAFGEFPQAGSVVWHGVNGGMYYYVVLLNSIPSDSVSQIEINDGIVLTFDDLDNAYDFNGPGARATGPYPWTQYDGSGAYITVWIGRGEQTAPPTYFDTGWKGTNKSDDLLSSTDAWTGSTVAFVRQVWSKSRFAKQITHGKPSPLKFTGKWSKVYDPRKDSTSGVTQFLAISPTASPEHDREDRTTWEYSSNPALCALTLARHRYALGLDDEMIPIQQWADAADACGDEYTAVSTVIDLDGVTRAAATYAGGVAAGITVSGFNPTDMVKLTLPAGQTYAAYSPWGVPAYSGGTTGSWNRVWAAIDGDADNVVSAGTAHPTNDNDSYDGYETARAAFGDQYITGGSSYTFFILDPIPGDNTGGLSIQIEASGSPRYRCDGLVTIENREVGMLDPVLNCMGGFIDPTDGLLGVRAGVWEAPTDALSQPLAAEIELAGARDSGFDIVRAKFISREREWSETNGPGFEVRTGFREKPLELPMVRESVQAARLEALTAKLSESRRTLTATWDGREFTRRVGDRVTASLPGFSRAAATYRIIAKAPVVEAAEDGVRLDVRMTLVEDLEANYDFTADEYVATEPVTVTEQTVEQIAAPTSVTLEERNYRNSAGDTVTRVLISVTITDDTSLNANYINIELSDGGSYAAAASLTIVENTLTYTAYVSPTSIGLTYTARAQTETSSGETSDWTTSNNITITDALDFDGADYSVEYA